MRGNREASGRYTHVWGWQGFDLFGREWQNCEHCGKWRILNPLGSVVIEGKLIPLMLYDSPDPATRRLRPNFSP